jgi:adenine-specific DNA-methyltransferase
MKSLPTDQKLRGGYYTPTAIADFLAQWAIRSPDSMILEPSCGDGTLLQSSVKTLMRCGVEAHKAISFVHGVELDSDEASKAVENIKLLSDTLPPVEIHIGDFFTYCKTDLIDKRLFDVVIGNPPFIRYQNFPEAYRTVAFELMQSAGLRPNRLTNIWVPFLVASTLLLNKNGRLAMVIPAELLQVNYAAELRYFLSEYYSTITMVTFRKLVFDGIQQEVVLLLCERNGTSHKGIRTVELNSINDLAFDERFIRPNGHLKELDHSTEKWTMYFLDQDELTLLRQLAKHPGLRLSGEVIDVDVGIVTGLNSFFVLTNEQREHYQLQSYTSPIVGRSTHLKGAVFSNADWKVSVNKNAQAYLFTPPALPMNALHENVQRYIASGESEGANKGYKCRIRKQWYIVPSVWTPDAFMLRQIHHYPKIILNSASATCTDTIHRVRMRNGVTTRTATAAFLNSLTFAFSETAGRSYGGGVLELEPNEAEKIPMPLVGADQLDLDEIDRLLRKDDIYGVLQITDEVLLQRGLGLSVNEVQRVRKIWEKLRDRRINRNHEKKAR